MRDRERCLARPSSAVKMGSSRPGPAPERGWRGRGRGRGGPRARALRSPVAVRMEGVVKRFGDVVAVDGVDLDVSAGGVLLDARAVRVGQDDVPADDRGLRATDRGHGSCSSGHDVSGLPPYDRDVNTVFQDYALFPHMTVAENVEYGLQVKKVPRRSATSGSPKRSRWSASSEFGDRKPGAALGRAATAGRARPRARECGRRCCCSTSRSARSI